MKKYIPHLILLFIMIVIIELYAVTQGINYSIKTSTYDSIKDLKNYKPLGTANKPVGKTLIISVFASDLNTSWDFTKESDVNTKNDCLNSLSIAAEYLTNEIKKFASNSEFLYDFNKYSDLKYETEFDKNLVVEDGQNYSYQKKYIDKNIDELKLLEKYNADNIIYIFFYNTPYSNTVKPRTFRHMKNNYVDKEIINLYVKFLDKYITSPSTYAHEILHTFGAYDLYYANNGITNDYVSHLSSIKSNDIMYTVTSSKKITNSFSELDAYYVGLIDKSSEQEKWNLTLSEHLGT